jgi:hypothetical protein
MVFSESNVASLMLSVVYGLSCSWDGETLCKAKVEVVLGTTVSRPVYLVTGTHMGPVTDFLISSSIISRGLRGLLM